MKNPFKRKPKPDPKKIRLKAENEALINRLQELERGKITNSEGVTLKHVFTTKSGVDYYTWPNIVDMPITRSVELQVLQKIEEMGMTRRIAEQFRDSMRQHAERGDLTEFFVIFSRFMERMNLKTTPDIILEQAAVIYITKDESTSQYDKDKAAQKIADWKADPEALAFFLLTSFRELYKVGNLSNELILNSLKELDEMDKHLLPQPLQTKYKSYIETLTKLSTVSQGDRLTKSKESGE